MRRLLLSVFLLALPCVAQQVKNPVSDAVRMILPQRSNNIVSAAEEMPADKYSFKPTAQQQTFGHLVMHIVQSNNMLCSNIGGTGSPSEGELKETDPKDKLVAALRRSFDTCNAALQALEDTKLGEEVTLFGGRKGTKATALVYLVGDWADHYGAEAMYLRLAGLTPPTAQRQRKETKD